jgi:signal transduction histidine kinase
MRFRNSGPYSLRFRVALSNAVTATLVGLGAAAVAAWLVSELTTASEDQRLRDIAYVMSEDLHDTSRTPQESVDDESREVAGLGVTIALFQDGVRRAGAESLRDPDRDGCFSVLDATGSEFRTCAVGTRARRVVVAAPRRVSDDERAILFMSIAGAAALAALAGTLASRVLAGVTSVAPAQSDLGAPSGVSEVEALRATLRDLLGRLGEALEQSRGFAVSAAHELRTPLALMTAEIELAAERAPAVAPELARVRKTLSRLTRLVERLLALASEPSPLADVREAVALEDVVRDVLGTYEPSQRDRVSASFEAPGMVRGDDALLRVAIDNLLENALKFDAAGTIHVAVSETAAASSLMVWDGGPGIEASEWSRLLRPFQRGSVAAPGHGLGLPIAAHVVRLHRGELALEPSDRGTRILVTLPAWRETGAPP